MSAKRKKLQLATLYTKRRKGAPLEEISYDAEARQEFLTGFHKRKVQRQKEAQEIAAKKEREEKLRERQQLREERRANVKARIEAVNAELRKQEAAFAGASDDGNSDRNDSSAESEDSPVDQEPVDHEDEYIDEDKFTTVTIEAVDVTREGMEKPAEDRHASANSSRDKSDNEKSGSRSDQRSQKKANGGNERPKLPKKKKKKFRYESKAERQANIAKVKMRKAKAKARRVEAD